MFDPPKKGDLTRVFIQILQKILSPPSPKWKTPEIRDPLRINTDALISVTCRVEVEFQQADHLSKICPNTKALTSTLVGLPASPDKILQLGFGPSSRPKSHVVKCVSSSYPSHAKNGRNGCPAAKESLIKWVPSTPAIGLMSILLRCKLHSSDARSDVTCTCGAIFQIYF